jgi:hypothetical protein
LEDVLATMLRARFRRRQPVASEVPWGGARPRRFRD